MFDAAARKEVPGVTTPLVAAPAPARLEGLSAGEVEERVAAGLVNSAPDSHTRSLGDIVRANVLTPFNAVLGVLLGVILVVGPIHDALFGVVLVANSLTGIVQEMRAKRTLDRLSLLNAPVARVIRDGATVEIPVEGVVRDDLVEIGPGDQVVADGVGVAEDELELNEALLTGESDPVSKGAGDTVLSGTFVAAGTGVYRATAVGSEAYATSLTEQARVFSLAHSELRAGVNRIIRGVGWLMAPTAALLVYSQLSAHDGVKEALRGTVAGVVAMVPEGLVLLTTVAFAVGVVRLGRVKLLVQELAAIETLARVDVLCVDKTGTITNGEISVREVRPLAGAGGLDDVLGALAAADPSPNTTLRALATRFAAPGWDVTHRAAFSARQRWSGATFSNGQTWLLGAPEAILPNARADADAIAETVEELAGGGSRVLLLARASAPLTDGAVPSALVPAAIVVLEDTIRDDAPATIAYFREQGVELKILSGDHPRTAGSIAARAGVEGAATPVDARTLPEDDAALLRAVESASVFGRVGPAEKRRVIRALKGAGHVVAMAGDGVNDVLALKDADIGIAMGSGTSAARGVSQMVLLDDSFATLPAAVAEGRKVINNIERVANLFLTKTVYSTLLALAIGVASLPFPFLPRHLTLIGALTIGIPAFFIALAPNRDRAHPGFVSRVLRFALPVGFLAAAATFAAYYFAQTEAGVALPEAKTTATLVLVAVGLSILTRLARPLAQYGWVLTCAMGAAFAAVLAVPAARDFFDLRLPPAIVILAALGIVWMWHLAMVPAMHVVDRLLRDETREPPVT